MTTSNEFSDEGGAREALIRSAMRVIANSGLRGMTYRAVATDAGLTHGLIVHYFGSRDALIAAAMQYATQRSLRDAAASENAQVSEIGSHLKEVVSDDEETIAFQREMLNEARRRPEIRPLARQMILDFEAAVHRQLTSLGIDDPDTVILVAAAMEGLIQRQGVMGDEEATDQAMEVLRRLLSAASPADSRGNSPSYDVPAL